MINKYDSTTQMNEGWEKGREITRGVILSALSILSLILHHPVNTSFFYGTNTYCLHNTLQSFIVAFQIVMKSQGYLAS